MNNLKNILIASFATAAVCLTACISFGSDDSERAHKERPLVSSMTITPEVPDHVSFCNEEIDMTRYDRHEALDRELSTFTYLHASTMLLIKRANRYFPIIEPVLREEGIPDDFKYLAVIESNLDPRIQSRAKAVGMWQFLEATGRQYGLTITPTVDERCHVEKAARAACRYLKDAYEKYGDWASVAASYNGGMGRISRELARQNVDRSLDLWLVEETTRYVYRIIAIKQIFEHPYKYGFVLQAKDLYKPIACTPVEISRDIPDLTDFASEQGITYADLKRFNPWLRDRKLQTNGKTFTLLIPQKEAMNYLEPNTYVHNPAWVIK